MTGHSPAALVFADNPSGTFERVFKQRPRKHSRFDFIRPLISLDVETKKSLDQYEREMQRLRRAKEERISKALAVQDEYDRRRQRSMNANRGMISFEPGDLVLQFIRNSKVGNDRKHHEAFIGPFKIAEKLSDVTYRLERSDKRSPVVHVENLKPFYE